MAKVDLSAARLRELLHYDPETGVFTRPGSIQRPDRAGKQAGHLTRKGYRYIKIGRVNMQAHRLAWLYAHGVWPQHDIDHIDGNPSNNAIANLRDVTRSVNCQNKKTATRFSKVGLLGVCAKNKGWTASIYVDGRQCYLGIFSSPIEAHAAYIAAKRQHHEGCTI